MKVSYRTFESGFMAWESLFDEAAEFASSLGPECVISISHSCDHSRGVVTVWYWDDQA